MVPLPGGVLYDFPSICIRVLYIADWIRSRANEIFNRKARRYFNGRLKHSLELKMTSYFSATPRTVQNGVFRIHAASEVGKQVGVAAWLE